MTQVHHHSLCLCQGSCVASGNDSLCRVWDNDGDFLLIEAAYALPKWLKPDTSRDRVWLSDGVLNIVPLPESRPLEPQSPAAHLPAAPTTAEALDVVAGDAIPTLGSAAVQVHCEALV